MTKEEAIQIIKESSEEMVNNVIKKIHDDIEQQDKQPEIPKGTLCYFWDGKPYRDIESPYKDIVGYYDEENEYGHNRLEDAGDDTTCHQHAEPIGIPWIKHTGDDMPVNGEQSILYTFANGNTGIAKAGNLFWSKSDPSPIIHYCPINKPSE